MDWIAIFNFLLIAGAVQGFAFNLGTFLIRRRIEAAVIFLNLFVLFISLNNLQSWIIDQGLTPEGYFWKHFLIPCYVLIVPMFYAFLVNYLGLQGQRRIFWRLSAALFLTELTARVVLLLAASKGLISEALLEDYHNIEDLVTLAYSLFFYFRAWHLLYTYPSLERPLLHPDNLKWVKRTMLLGGLIMILWLLAISLNIFSEIFRPPYTYYPLRLTTSLLIYWMGYQAFFQYVLLQDRLALRKKLGRKPVVSGAMAISEADGGDGNRSDFVKIDAHVREQQSYLDPTLGQESLAGELGIGTSTMSRLVNRFSGHNFPDYINAYRVDHARELLGDPDFSAYTITAIGLESGFNSKSTFYTAFRKFTGMTPSEFRGGN